MKNIRKHDWLITAVTWVLVALSITTIYSITYSAESVIQGAGTANRQFIFALIGIAVFFSISIWLDYTYLNNKTILGLIYFVVVGLLIALFIVSQANRGSIRWISIGPLNIEPSELSKILVILISSSAFARRFDKDMALKDYVLSILPIIPLLALIFIQPDLSTTLSLIFIFFSIYISSAPDISYVITSFVIGLLSFVSTFLIYGDYGFFHLVSLEDFVNSTKGIHWIFILFSLLVFIFVFFIQKKNKLILIGVILLGVCLSVGYIFAWNNVLEDYQKSRIDSFINPEEDPLGAGYQVNQSIIATGSGQLWGRGFGRGSQSNLNFLPERHTDFIFASYAEEFGFIGTLLLLGLYFILIIKIVRVGISSKDPHGYLVCIGVASMILFQFIINVGMNIGLMPVTGITLPLFSYGGSSLLTTLIGIAIVQSVAHGRELIDIGDSLVIREDKSI